MIYSIGCDHPSFHNIEFTSAFNVVLATRTKAASDKDSRNGAGKTTLIEIIHFLLGASANKKSRLMVRQLRGWNFTIDLDLRGKRHQVSRNTESPRKIVINGDFSEWPIKPKKDTKSGQYILSNTQWSEVLGWLMFDLPAQSKTEKYEPTFRSLFSYFVRRGRDAFSIPFEHFRKQKEWDKQINNAFLLGLSWEYPSKLQQLRDQEKIIGQLRAAIKTGSFAELLGTVGALTSQKVRLEEITSKRGTELSSFRVHPQYAEFQEQSNAIQSSIRELNRENATDSAMLAFYRESLNEETVAGSDKLNAVYREAGVNWPAGVQKRLDEVAAFHEKLISNRRAFLQSEIFRLQRALTIRTELIERQSNERAKLLELLNTHGALAEYAALQRLQSEELSKLNEVNQKIATLNRINEIKSQMKIDREQLQILARESYAARGRYRERAISLFNRFSEALYRRAGELIVDINDGGYSFRVEIERQDSQGVEQMKVFLYDMMLATLWAEKPSAPGFLVHDSTIFADVDERQKAHALELAAKSSAELGFQYICCLNSDAIPTKDFSSDFSLEPFVRMELTDADDTGGLLGIRY